MIFIFKVKYYLMKEPSGITPFALLIFQFYSLLHFSICFSYKNRLKNTIKEN